MHNQPIYPYYQQVPPMVTQQQPYQSKPEGMPRVPEERKMQPPAAMMTPPKAPVASAATAVPIQLAKDFLNVVKKGNVGEIQGFIGTCFGSQERT